MEAYREEGEARQEVGDLMAKQVSGDLATDILEKVNYHKRHTKQLRERMESDFALYRLEPFKMSTVGDDEGNWDEVTCNDPVVLASKCIELITQGTVRVTCGTLGNKKEREGLALTEQFAYGSMNKIDERLGRFLQPDLKSSLGVDAVLRGWVGLRAFLYNGEDDKPVFDVVPWDIRNTYWGMGRNGLLWACHTYYESPEAVEDQWGEDAGKLMPDTEGRILVYDYWDDKQQTTMVDLKVVGQVKHKLKRVPVFILPVGGMRLIQSSIYRDTIKGVGESIYQNNRDLFDLKSRWLTYFTTLTGENVRTTVKVFYNAGNPPRMDRKLRAKDRAVMLDKSKGQDIEDIPSHQLTAEAYQGLNEVSGMLNAGGAPPVLMGNAEGTNTVGGLNILSHNAMTMVGSRNRAVEQALSWLAKELVLQYSEGDFESVHFDGVDGRSQEYSVDVSKDKLVTDRPIRAENKLNLPQDEMTMAGIVDRMKASGIWSVERAMDKMGVPDPDVEKGIINREKGEAVMPLALLELQDQLIKDRSPYVWVVQRAIEQMLAQAQQPPQGGPGQPPAPGGGLPSPGGVVPRPGIPALAQGMNPKMNQQGMNAEDMRAQR